MINRVYHLDRGFERLEEKLGGCGRINGFRVDRTARAFSSKVETGLRRENAAERSQSRISIQSKWNGLQALGSRRFSLSAPRGHLGRNRITENCRPEGETNKFVCTAVANYPYEGAGVR